MTGCSVLDNVVVLARKNGKRLPCERLQMENAKLRDWCGEMLDSLMPEICAKAYWCEEKDWRTCNDDSCGNYSFVIISRELGIEATA